MRRTTWLALAGLTVIAAVAAAFLAWTRPGPRPAVAAGEAPPVSRVVKAKQKVLFVDSYHEGYPWSDSILDGALKTLKIRRLAGGQFDCSASPVTLAACHMDTKRHGSAEFKRQAGLKVKAVIESFKPDLVICSDDNATAYVLAPFYRNAAIPFVFCGINWDATEYGLPYRNATGMVEVSFLPKLVEALRVRARGPRLGVLGARNESNVKEVIYYRKMMGTAVEREVLVDTFEQWKAAYVELQDQVDMLILAPPSFIESEQDQATARKFVLANTRIPTGSVEAWIAPYALICHAKLGSEQGEWTAQAALQILGGVSPADIPVVGNHLAQLYLNMPLAKKLKVTFPVELVEQAVLVNED
jgi:ABC-type uncharacterized transport system substrate-binding protein